MITKPDNFDVGFSYAVEVNLDGPDGNAFCLLAIASDLCHGLKKDYDLIGAEMKSGDYENLIAVFEREFGDLVIMYRAS